MIRGAENYARKYDGAHQRISGKNTSKVSPRDAGTIVDERELSIFASAKDHREKRWDQRERTDSAT